MKIIAITLRKNNSTLLKAIAHDSRVPKGILRQDYVLESSINGFCEPVELSQMMPLLGTLRT